MVLTSSNGISRVPPYFSTYQGILFQLQGFHLLWPTFPSCSSIIYFCNCYKSRLLRVRSPLLTESFLLSFPTGTKMFQFPAFPHSFWSVSPLPGDGLPHSDTCVSLLTYSSTQHFVVSHVLLRRLVPRHPLYALTSLTLHQNLSTFQRSKSLNDFFNTL